eukprot:2080767-Amphidinium_carterae.1
MNCASLAMLGLLAAQDMVRLPRASIWLTMHLSECFREGHRREHLHVLGVSKSLHMCSESCCTFARLLNTQSLGGQPVGLGANLHGLFL